MVKGTLNSECAFLFSRRIEVRTNPDSKLFWFELDTIIWQGRLWLVEWCVLWNGDRQIVEMVEIRESLDDYFEKLEEEN
jgi:hypothetical protein